MKRLILPTLCSTILLFSATPEQVEAYLSVSNAQEQLVELESMFDSMQSMLKADANISTAYDSQMLSLRFRKKLSELLSEDEMDEILANYKDVLYLQFISATNNIDYDASSIESYYQKAQEDEELKKRLDYIEDITKHLYKEAYLKEYYEALIEPFYKKSNTNKALLEQQQKAYIETMVNNGEKLMLYALKEFSTEELEALAVFVQRPSIDTETKTIYKALVYAMQEYFNALLLSFDNTIPQHQQYNIETNTTR